MAKPSDVLAIIDRMYDHKESKFEAEEARALNLIQLNAQRDENQLARKHGESQTYLKYNLEKLNNLNAELSELENKSVDLGLVGTKLSKVSTPSSGVQDVYSTSIESLTADIKYKQDEIDRVRGDQKNYYAGLNLAKLMDKDISGIVDEGELNTYINNEEISDEFVDNDAFMYGVQSYTLSPEKRAALLRAKTEQDLLDISLKTEEAKFELLPADLKADADLKQIKIKTGNAQVDLLREQYKQAKEQTKVAIMETSLLEAKKENVILKFDAEEYARDKQLRTDHIASIEQMIVNNIEAQSGIGAGLLSNIMLELENDEYTPMFSILAAPAGSEEGQASKYLSDIGESSSLNLISDDIQKLYSSYGLGKSEEQVPDYTFVLDKIEDIVQIHGEYKDFIQTFSSELEESAKKLQRDKYSVETIQHVINRQHVAMTIYPDEYNLTNLLKAVQWSNTGIYSNMDMLSSALNAKQQYKDLHSMLEQAKGLDITYSNDEYGKAIYTPDQVENIMIPFTTRTDYQINQDVDLTDPNTLNTINDIFNIQLSNDE